MADTRLFTVPAEGGLPKALPMPVSGGGDVFARRTSSRLFAADPRIPHLEAVSGGLGARPLHLRPGDFRHRARCPLASIRARPDVDRRQDLFRFRPYGHAQPLRVRHPLPRASGSSPRAPSTTSAGRAPATPAGSSTNWAAKSMSSISSRAGRQPIPITVPTDALARRPSRVVVAPILDRRLRLEPQGRAGLVRWPRGHLLGADRERGRAEPHPIPRVLTTRRARWSPDGLKVAYISDAQRRGGALPDRPDGTGKPEQLTKDGHAMRYAPEWSPDGKRLAFSDKDGKVFVLTLADKSLMQVADEAARSGVRLRLVAVWHASGVQPQRPELHSIALHLERRPDEAAPDHRRDVRRV